MLAPTQRGFIPVELARTHRQLGSALLALGAWDEALVQARTGLGIATDDPRGVEEAACHGLLATILAYRGDTNARCGARGRGGRVCGAPRCR